MPLSSAPFVRALLIAAVAASACPGAASAEALLLVEADTGKVLHAENATAPWHPASVTKLMTTYVTLHAIKEGRVTPDRLVTVSRIAAAQQPSKMGFKPGIQLTIDNALKIMMVKSANDVAVVLAEGVAGSVENFVGEMNRAAQRLGMTQTSFVNPNGLPADGQVTSARDLAILARALIREFPEYDLYWHIPSIQFGRRVMRNFNPLIDRYPGADGMKTGFICASGFNLVATATRGNKRLIAVVLGARSSAARAQKAAQLLERGFGGNILSWLLPSLGSVEGLTPVAAEPPDLHEEVCGKNRHRPAETTEEEAPPSDADQRSFFSTALNDLGVKSGKSAPLLGPLVPSMAPIVVFVGPANKQGSPAAPRPPKARTAPRSAGKPAPAPSAAVPVPRAPPQH